MPVVDVFFRLQGGLIPADHGYLLFSALSAIIPELHGDNAVGVHPISGRLAGNRSLILTHSSFLTIRLPAERVSQFMQLAGKALSIGDSQVRTGVPHTRALLPSSTIHSRLVVIKGFMEPEPFLEAAYRQLETAGIRGQPRLKEQAGVAKANAGLPTGSHSTFLRRTIRIRDKEIVGFALEVQGLSPADSIALQEAGLGGRQRFGCGVFVPTPGQRAEE